MQKRQKRRTHAYSSVASYTQSLQRAVRRFKSWIWAVALWWVLAVQRDDAANTLHALGF